MQNKRRVVWLIQKWTVPVLLILVAVRQIVLAHTVGLSAWHGGGFGMFASIDRDERRLIEVWGTDIQGSSVKIDLTTLSHLFSEKDLIAIRTIPKKALLQEVAQKVLDFDFLEDEDGSIYYLPTTEASLKPPQRLIRLQQVTVQVWRLYHDRTTSRIWYEPLSPVVEAIR